MSQRETFVNAALLEIGKPYTTHRDCSGFTAWAARQAGFTLPEGSVAQYRQGSGVPVRDLIAGDLVFWDTFGPSPGHVAIAINPSQVIHALNESRGIIVSEIYADMGGPMVGVRRLALDGDGATPDPKDTPVDPWRPMAYPRMRDAIVDKAYDGAGFNRVAFRGDRIVGICDHITDGDPDGDAIDWYRRFFSIGGERAGDALTDTVIARDGEIGLLNDWRDPRRGGTRAGWANGTTEGLEGEGVTFFRTYPAINDVLVSIEHVARAGQAITDAQMQSSIALSAAIAQAVKCPYNTYPYHPGKHGVNIEMMHYLFALKACPTEPFISTYYPAKVREVRRVLTQHQTGSSNPPGPPVPPADDLKYPFGFTREAIDYFWGTLDTPKGPAKFDPKGPLSLLWLHRCEIEGRFPEAEAWKVFGGRDVVQWEGGWTAIREPSKNGNASWTWLDKGAPAPTIVRKEDDNA